MTHEGSRTKKQTKRLQPHALAPVAARDALNLGRAKHLNRVARRIASARLSGSGTGGRRRRSGGDGGRDTSSRCRGDGGCVGGRREGHGGDAAGCDVEALADGREDGLQRGGGGHDRARAREAHAHKHQVVAREAAQKAGVRKMLRDNERKK